MGSTGILPLIREGYFFPPDLLLAQFPQPYLYHTRAERVNPSGVYFSGCQPARSTQPDLGFRNCHRRASGSPAGQTPRAPRDKEEQRLLGLAMTIGFPLLNMSVIAEFARRDHKKSYSLDTCDIGEVIPLRADFPKNISG